MENLRATHSNSRPILELRRISKRFGHVDALVDVDFEMLSGEILALVGDNGAGKSTLIKIASGVYQPDAGEIFIDGQRVHFDSPHDARNNGIATVHQDLALADDRDVAANLFLGREPTRYFMVDQKRMNHEARQVLNRLRINIPSIENLVGLLSGGQRQAVAIGRAISQGGRVFIMDEPTAALGVRESAKVLRLILGLKEEGSSVVVISHNMRHVFSIADRITVLRHGRKVGTRVKSESSPDDIVRMITGANMLVADAADNPAVS
jgi:ABC-type sugar transport system ATPase subunit